MKLYYTPGSCALAVHISLLWAKADFELILADLEDEKFAHINPLKAVPALVIDNQEKAMTQAQSLLIYIADLFQDKNLAGERSLTGRQAINEWLSFLTSDLHPAFGPIFAPDRYTFQNKQDDKRLTDVKKAASERVKLFFTILNNHLKTRDYIVGTDKTIVDAYAYVLTRWLGYAKLRLTDFPALQIHFESMSKDPDVIQAVKEQGLT